MPLRETEAIVLRTYRLGEADKIASLFTRQMGRLRAVARGALRPKGRYGGVLEPLSYVRAEIFDRENRDLLHLNAVELIESFFSMQKDYRVQLAAQFLAEVGERLLPEREANERTFRLLLAVLRALKTSGEVSKTQKSQKSSNRDIEASHCLPPEGGPGRTYWPMVMAGLAPLSLVGVLWHGLLPRSWAGPAPGDSIIIAGGGCERRGHEIIVDASRPRRALSRAEAWACFSANLALPGAGSLVAGRAVGYGQMACAFLGVFVTLVTAIPMIQWVLSSGGSPSSTAGSFCIAAGFVAARALAAGRDRHFCGGHFLGDGDEPAASGRRAKGRRPPAHPSQAMTAARLKPRYPTL